MISRLKKALSFIYAFLQREQLFIHFRHFRRLRHQRNVRLKGKATPDPPESGI